MITSTKKTSGTSGETSALTATPSLISNQRRLNFIEFSLVWSIWSLADDEGDDCGDDEDNDGVVAEVTKLWAKLRER